VIDMQEELRNQAFKLFSGFPYSPGGAEPGPEAAPEPEAQPRAKAARKKKAK
jgi:hypothetical protein